MVAFVFVLVTVIDTLGTGEHYLIDLVVAFPFAVAVQTACARPTVGQPRMRHVALLGSTAAVIAWLILLRYATSMFLLTPILPWMFVATSITISIWCTRFIVPIKEDIKSQSTPLARAVSASS
jgi:tryptophan-rich sensory protein